MSKTRTSVHSRDGKIAGKTVTTSHDGGGSKSTSYKNTSPGSFWGPSYKATSTTRTDSKGNTRTKTYK